MKKLWFFLLWLIPLFSSASNDGKRTVIDLNGTWQFDQTVTAFPPLRYTRTIPVPGLVHLAEPKIEEYDKFFKRPGKAEAKDQHSVYNIDYTPRYSWYRKIVFIPKELEGKEGMITVKKSQYVTQIYVNGIDLGTSMACYTPVEFPVTGAVKYGAENEILIKIGDRVWLPAEAAGGTDKEKEHYLPGIWDDVFLSFTGKMRINRLLVLPSVSGRKVTVKTQLRNLIPAQIFVGDAMKDSVNMDISIAEKLTGKIIAAKSVRFSTKRDNLTEVAVEIPVTGFTNWTPEHPFLYIATATLKNDKGISDEFSRQFGMRDFTRKGKFFYLNGEKYILRGTNVTLQRFFEDPDCSNLVWDKAWVKRLLVEYPKQLNWNAMRICVGIAPDFWYDIADENGLLFQNEWLYWQNHGWNDQIRKEYTDWLWSDGSHPSIGIWDAINENWDDYIGNTLIPELKKLDPTRIWDSGYMKTEEMPLDEMDEPHPYQGRIREKGPASKDNFYPLGNLDYKPARLQEIQDASTVQLVNEYGWIWLWRNGMPSKLTTEVYDYYLGKNSTPDQNRELQAYWMELETEWLRSEPSIAGVLAFCYLANNYGYTGDWFQGNIRDLQSTPTLDWFRHAFAPAATYIDLTDERYTKYVEPHLPGSELLFNLAGINNLPKMVSGTITIKVYNSMGIINSEKSIMVKLPSWLRTDIPVGIKLPAQPGGYLLVAKFTPENGSPVLSRRFLKVGEMATYSYFSMDPKVK
jgi:hypothetical protein